MGNRLLICALTYFFFITCLHTQTITNATDTRTRSITLADTAITRLDLQLQAAVKAGNWRQAAYANYDIGEIFLRRLKNDEAIPVLLQSLVYARKAGDLKAEAAGNLELGAAYFGKFNYPAAMEHSLQTIRLCRQLNEPEIELRGNNRIGMIYKYLEDNEKALEYFLPAYEEARRINKGPMTELLINIGNVEEALGHYEVPVRETRTGAEEISTKAQFKISCHANKLQVVRSGKNFHGKSN